MVSHTYASKVFYQNILQVAQLVVYIAVIVFERINVILCLHFMVGHKHAYVWKNSLLFV